jgi:putative redox protein
MDHNTNTEWKGNLVFESEINGFKFDMDGDNKVASSPKPLLLSSLAACAGIDIISILKKMRENVKSLSISVNGDLTDEHPRVYKNIEILIRISGENLNHEKVEKAVTLSKEKYCGVSAMLGKSAELEYVVEYGGISNE